MQFLQIKTRKLRPPKDDLFSAMLKSLPKLRNGDMVFITSKVLAIHQGRCVKINPGDSAQKSRLVRREAEKLLPSAKNAPHPFTLTIKNHTLIPSAGIDESNADGYYILWPSRIQAAAKQIWHYLKTKYKLGKIGVIITDSHTTPLRWGTQGICIGFYGFEPVEDCRGKQDIFGHKLKYTQKNIVDPLAAMAVLKMGEAGEQTPLLVLRDANFVKFTDKNRYRKLVVPPKNDLYYQLLKTFKKQ